MNPRILIVEDEVRFRQLLRMDLESAGYEVDAVGSAEEAELRAREASLILTDLRLPGMDGVQLLEALRQSGARIPVVLMTAFGTVERAVMAMKLGAADFLVKPFDLDHLREVIARALEPGLVERRTAAEGRDQFPGILGDSPALEKVLAAVERVAPTNATVLIAGESGTGKDLIARAIHLHSPRRDRPFVKINCAAIPESLLESELFGHERGAFTGALQSRPGKFEEADTGTVFLDEIGEVTASVQVKLLRVLQERVIERLGSNRSKLLDVRVIAATNRNLEEAIRAGQFRQDLYFRLNVVPIYIPALRDRKEDIPLLALHFLDKFRKENPRVQRFHPEALRRLCDYDWPGNVRQLENVIERAVILANGSEILPEGVLTGSLGTGEEAPSQFLPEGRTLEQHEKALIREALRRAQGNKSRAARMLGMTRNTLRYRLAQMEES